MLLDGLLSLQHGVRYDMDPTIIGIRFDMGDEAPKHQCLTLRMVPEAYVCLHTTGNLAFPTPALRVFFSPPDSSADLQIRQRRNGC